MQRMASDHRFKTALLVLMAAAVLAITVTRAAITEITYDEAFTYMAYAQEIRFDEFDTFRYVYNESVANNHWLNTVAIAAVNLPFGFRIWFSSQFTVPLYASVIRRECFPSFAPLFSF